MNNAILTDIMKDFERKRNQAEKDLDIRKAKLYEENPRLQEIDNKLSKLGIAAAKSLIMKNDQDVLNSLQEQTEKLKKEKLNILKKLKLPEDFLKPAYSCKICNDTGYVTENNSSKMCNCLKQKIFDFEYNKSNVSNLQFQNFDNFSYEKYSDVADKAKYGSDISPRENIKLVREICNNFINNFDDPNEKNLLFTGTTGVGKTFLSSCIAKELIDQGKTVLYQTAPVMLDMIVDYKFGKNNISDTTYKNLFDVDLLIIDDLGTESMNQVKFAELFNIINSRLLNTSNKNYKTIISTNLNLPLLNKTYGERISSRLIGNYNICRFFGEDLRFTNS